MEVIKVPDLTKGERRNYNGWVNTKMITPKGIYRLVGWGNDVERYIEKEKITGFAITCYIMNKKVRDTSHRLYKSGRDTMWFFSDPVVKPWAKDWQDKPALIQRKWRIFRYRYGNFEKRQEFNIRRLPNKWSSLYEELLQD